MGVSIPYLSGHPFLRTPLYGVWALTSKVCQSPIYRDTHFYIGKDPVALYLNDDVSIPYLSGHPFLHTASAVCNSNSNVSIPYLSGHPFLQSLAGTARCRA